MIQKVLHIGAKNFLLIVLLFSLAQLLPEVFAQTEVRLDLVPPTEIEGYAAGLQVGQGDLTTLVVHITNYVLGFLGLLAMTAIVYAGILYVANFGNDDMTGKAKNIILYVSIGSLVIILSYSIVNALFGITTSGTPGGGSGGVAPGRISPSDFPVVTLDSLFDVKGKDYILPLVKSIRDLGDLCPDTPIGLNVAQTGCAQNELLPDTDGDGTANVLDTDDDDDGIPDEADPDADGDKICSVGKSDAEQCSLGSNDQCPDTLNFVVFKVQRVERDKLQVDRARKEDYEAFLKEHQGCAEYEQLSNIDGDYDATTLKPIADFEDCDRDGDGLLDSEQCLLDFASKYRNTTISSLPDGETFKGARVKDVIQNELDADSDNDGVTNFGASFRVEERELLLQEVVNNFQSLENFLRITCATLPQTKKVLDYCRINPPGKIIRLLDRFRGQISLNDLEEFSTTYDEFIILVKTFPRVQAVMKTPNNVTEEFLSAEGQSFKMSFDATDTVDPYQQFCPVKDQNFLWFVNKDIDFNQGLAGILSSQTNPPDATGVFFTKEFIKPGVYNIQLLAKSSCKFNIVNPGAGESADVDAAVAGLTSVRINIFPPKARLVVRVNGQADPGINQPFRIPSNAQGTVQFDLRESVNNRGTFTKLIYDCGLGSLQEINSGPPSWQFTCNYPQTTGTKQVTLRARDAQGEISRTVILNFKEVVAKLLVLPGLVGKTSTDFTLDASSSQASQPIKNFTFKLSKKNDESFKREFQNAIINFRFPSPGEYTVLLEVSTGGAEHQIDTISQTITVEEQEPVAAFRISFPEKIRPARALFDGSLSFHPDFPTGAVFGYSWDVNGIRLQPKSATATSTFVYEQVVAGKDDKIIFEFPTIGDHQVILTVTKGTVKDSVTEAVKIPTLLGVDFAIDRPASRVGEIITFTPMSDKALAFFWDFGDGITVVGNRAPFPGGSFSNPAGEPAKHKFDKQGSYKVKLTVEDGANNTNSVVKVVNIGIQNTPMAFAQVFVNGIEQLVTEDCLELSRRDTVLFSAEKSLNVKGDTSGLSFLWETEDSEDIVRQKTFSKNYKEVSEGCFEVILTVTDLSTQVTAKALPILLKVKNMLPDLTDVRYTIQEQNLVTPVTASVSAVGPRDFDGRIVRYYWYYFEQGNPSKKLDPRVSDIPRTTFIIPPSGPEGTKSTYEFVVEVEDNDGAKFSSRQLTTVGAPLTLTNGPNIAPKAEFIAERTTAKIGETINFSSKTRDPLGEFLPSAAFQWDLNGDSEFDREYTGPKVSYRYQKAGNFKVTLRVVKNGLSSQYDMTVTVVPVTKKPEAAFLFTASGSKVKFISNSSVDPALDNKDLRHEWDFDSGIDTDGNGTPDDDVDSADLSPVHEFKGDKDVRVVLRVIDSVGNTSRVMRTVPFVLGEQLGALGAKKEPKKFKAVMQTNPPVSELDGKIYLTPPASDVVFIMKKSAGRIQEYRLDANMFVDSDNDGVAENDVDNKTHKSWKDGSPFKVRYNQTDGKIRAKLTIADPENHLKSATIDIVFQDKKPAEETPRLEKPEDIEKYFEKRPFVIFDMSVPFAKPKETVSFDASKTRFPEEKIKEYRWDFDGDGLVDEISFEPGIKHAFEKVGAYEVILEAVTEQGLQGEYSQTIFIRGGLQLPEASFTTEIKDSEVHFTNTSVVDPSMKEEELKFEWVFAKVLLGDLGPWQSFEKTETYESLPGSSDESPLLVEKTLNIPEQVGGLVPREVVLGRDPAFVRFKRGTTFASGAAAYNGEVSISSQETSEGLLIQTGLEKELTLSDPAQLILTDMYRDAELLGIEKTTIAKGTVENNQTIFEMASLAPEYLIKGSKEEKASQQEEVLGSDSSKNPVRTFSEKGSYTVTLKVTDSVGEVSEKSDIITIDQVQEVLAEVEPETVEEIPPPTFPTPEIRAPEGPSGFSLWLIVVIILVLSIFGGILFIVIRTIRGRQADLEAPAPVATPEVVEAKPRVAKSAPEASPAPEKKPEEQKPKEKKEPPAPPPASTGPIPDWLKG